VCVCSYERPRKRQLRRSESPITRFSSFAHSRIRSAVAASSLALADLLPARQRPVPPVAADRERSAAAGNATSAGTAPPTSALRAENTAVSGLSRRITLDGGSTTTLHELRTRLREPDGQRCLIPALIFSYWYFFFVLIAFLLALPIGWERGRGPHTSASGRCRSSQWLPVASL
jgi:hypothetical protein